jgi:putative nucleotidyltransferase with HDIG domain
MKTLICIYLEKIKQHDEDTYLHCLRVASISTFISRCIELTVNEMNELITSAYLHDVGKIQIPVDTLNCPRKLSEPEWDIIKNHPAYGAEALSLAGEKFPQSIINGIISHHEQYNGQGYRGQLKGEDIPLFGRVIAIADAFDAMVSFRPYKKQKSLDDAATELLEKSGSQFDPYIVRKIMAHQTEILHRSFFQDVGTEFSTPKWSVQGRNMKKNNKKASF